MNTNISDYLANVQGDATIAVASNGYVRVYDNSVARPASASTPVPGGAVLLVEPRLAATASAGTVDGLITFNIVGNASILASGTASWFRVFKSDGTTALLDGDIGVTGSGANMIMNSTALSSGAALGITSFTHDIRNATAGL